MKRKLLRDFGGKKAGQFIEVEGAKAKYLQKVKVIGAAEKEDDVTPAKKQTDTAPVKKAKDVAPTKKASDTKPVSKKKA